MKNTVFLFISLFSFICCYAQKTEIIVIGAIHQAVPNYNSDTIVTILNKIHPDFLLQELDSSYFTTDFHFKEKATENEGIASEKYILKNPKTQMRPFDFEGRNEYRKEIGSRPTDELAVKLLDSLYNKNLLTDAQSKIYKKYKDLLEPLKIAASKDAKSFNNSSNDKICKERQYYQYAKLLEIIKQRSEFSTRFYTKPNGEKISYEKGYALATEFWDLRNQTMAKNILKIANENFGKRVVVLTGFMHRYYIISELKRITKNDKNITIKEFYN